MKSGDGGSDSQGTLRPSIGAPPWGLTAVPVIEPSLRSHELIRKPHESLRAALLDWLLTGFHPEGEFMKAFTAAAVAAACAALFSMPAQADKPHAKKGMPCVDLVT